MTPPPPTVEHVWDEARTIISSAIEERFTPGCLTDARAAIDVAAPAVAEALAKRDHVINTLRAQVLRLQPHQEATS